MPNTLPDGFTARAPTRDDARAIVDLINDYDVAITGERDADINLILDDWNNPKLDLANDARLVHAPDGTLVGYEILYRQVDNGTIHTDGYVHPDYTGRGIGTWLLRWAEESARDRITTRYAPDLEVSLRIGIYTADAEASALFRNEGYVTIRHFWRMDIAMNEPPSPPELPGGISIRPFVTGQDERATYDAEVEGFGDHWDFSPIPYEEWLKTRVEAEDFDPSLWFLAMDGSQIAGLARCRVRLGQGWVGSLSVRRPWRHRGLGMALLKHAFGEFYRRGKHQVGLGVDAQSLTGATRLYERAGMKITHQYDTVDKVLRAGTGK